MIEFRKSEDRHHENFGWLDARWSFSFGDYNDPQHMSFGPLRVFNDDIVKPSTGFPLHPHREMEIVTFVLSGAVEHQDSMGNRTTIRAGEVQRMSAGTGVRHSERNPSETEPLHLLQVWFLPERSGLAPSYEQKAFTREQRQGRLLPVISGTPMEGAVSIHQDVTGYLASLRPGSAAGHNFAAGRRGYLFVIDGAARLAGTSMAGGDAAKITAEPQIRIEALGDSELLLLDMI